LREVSVVGNSEGNKVTETIFTGSREFIMLVDSGEIISQSPEPRSVSGADYILTEQITYLQSLPPIPPTECSHSYRKLQS
jgi:hypothetical protein